MNFDKYFLLPLIISSFFFVSSPINPKTMDESEESNVSEKITYLNQDNSFYNNRTIIKAVEPVFIQSSLDSGLKKIKARIDTGATQSSIDINLAKELGYTKYIGQINVVSANGIKTRPLVEITYELSGKRIKSTFTLANRKNLNYSVLIGRNDLEGFLIDPIDN
ncbi:MAG: hypothetical protein U0354_16190 [Candidatus Sericytochromatia bacterium]